MYFYDIIIPILCDFVSIYPYKNILIKIFNKINILINISMDEIEENRGLI